MIQMATSTSSPRLRLVIINTNSSRILSIWWRIPVPTSKNFQWPGKQQFCNFWKRGQVYEVYRIFRFHLTFLPKFPELSVEWFAFGNSTISEFSWHFPGKFLYHLFPFRNFWLNGKHPYSPTAANSIFPTFLVVYCWQLTCLCKWGLNVHVAEPSRNDVQYWTRWPLKNKENRG